MQRQEDVALIDRLVFLQSAEVAPTQSSTAGFRIILDPIHQTPGLNKWHGSLTVEGATHHEALGRIDRIAHRQGVIGRQGPAVIDPDG